VTSKPNDDFVLVVDPAHPHPRLAGGIFAIGNFDGVHLGHRAVIEATKALARARGVPAAVLTFEPHPADYFAGKPVVFRLTPMAEKVKVLRGLGLDGTVVLTFDAALAGLSAEGFVEDILVRSLRLGAAVVGADFHFGKGRSGSPAFLAREGLRLGFGVEILDKVESGALGERETVSSSAIRRALERGDVEGAALSLGRAYSVTGCVIKGQQLGRTLDTPTANLALEPTNRLAYGVYAVRAVLGGISHDGVASFGVRPTVNGVEPLLETFIFDFSADIYGRELTVEIVARIRDELKFDGLDALKAEMKRDVERARKLLIR
jgi:riboflavin kinase / FMN adenylyltransferase